MANRERFLFETEAEVNAFVKGVNYVGLAGVRAEADPSNLAAWVVLHEDEDLPELDEVWQDLAAYVDHFAYAGFRTREIWVGERLFLRWELALADGRVVTVAMHDNIRLPGYDDQTQVRIYGDQGLDENTVERRTYQEPRSALLALCDEFQLPTPSAEELEQEYENPC